MWAKHRGIMGLVEACPGLPSWVWTLESVNAHIPQNRAGRV